MMGSGGLSQSTSRKRWVHSEFVDRLPDHDHVMAKHLGQDLVRHADRGLGQDRIAELPLDHGEGSLHVRPLVIAPQEVLPLVGEQVIHPRPGRVSPREHGGGVRLERDVGLGPDALDQGQVLLAQVRLVGRTSVRSKLSAVACTN